jgi:hypothetical protein
MDPVLAISSNAQRTISPPLDMPHRNLCPMNFLIFTRDVLVIMMCRQQAVIWMLLGGGASSWNQTTLRQTAEVNGRREPAVGFRIVP